MTLFRHAQHIVIASLFAASALMPHAARADINVSADTATSGLTDTMGQLATDTSTAATTDNVGILQTKLDVLNAQIASTSAPDKLAQLQATSTALKSIIAKVKDGYAITNYQTSMDVSDQVTTITTTFVKSPVDGVVGSTSTFVLTSIIPPLDNPDDTYNSGSNNNNNSNSNNSGGSSGGSSADMLTQLLQQAGLQQLMGGSGMGGGGSNPLSTVANALTGGQNPLSNIQSSLNNLVNNNGSQKPVTPEDKCMSDVATKKGVAVYDISAGKVYMPDGTVLDAHSGMGAMKDNPDSVNSNQGGATPPGLYNVGVRTQGLFHNVEAVRLNPVGGQEMYGRDGFLAHSKLVSGAQNGSHGCVAFDNYGAFLAAFKNGQVKQLMVVSGKKGKGTQQCRPPTVNTNTPQSGAGGMAPNF